jgi:hypothetical protein
LIIVLIQSSSSSVKAGRINRGWFLLVVSVFKFHPHDVSELSIIERISAQIEADQRQMNDPAKVCKPAFIQQ